MIKIKYLSKIFIQVLMYLSLAIGISPFSSSINGYNVKFPFLVLGVIILLRSKDIGIIIRSSLHSKKNHFIQMLILFMALTGLITGVEFWPVIVDYMAIAFFFYLLSLSLRTKERYEQFHRFTKSLFATISVLELIIMYWGLSDVVIMSHRPISLAICPFFMSMIFLKERRILLSIIFFSILAYMTIRGAMRVNYIVVILYILYLLYKLFFRYDLKFSRKMLMLIILSSIIMIGFPIAKNYIESDASRNLHMVTRFTNMFDSDMNEEKVREETNKLIINHTTDFIVPQGLGWQNHVKTIQAKYRSQYGVLSTMDSNLLYCAYHFGIFIGVYIMIIVIIPCIQGVFKAIVNIRDESCVFAGCCFVAILSMFILKSWIFVYSSFGITYGILFAYTYNLNKHSLKND